MCVAVLGKTPPDNLVIAPGLCQLVAGAFKLWLELALICDDVLARPKIF